MRGMFSFTDSVHAEVVTVRERKERAERERTDRHTYIRTDRHVCACVFDLAKVSK
jgi:hypothetical protein